MEGNVVLVYFADKILLWRAVEMNIVENRKMVDDSKKKTGNIDAIDERLSGVENGNVEFYFKLLCLYVDKRMNVSNRRRIDR